jgi:4a-hydroxytetrahydrobiopterin dehydratase
MSQSDRLYTPVELADHLRDLPAWTYRDGAIRRSYQTTGWSHTLLVVNAIGFLCEAADHHPDLTVGWNRVDVALHTHSAGGVTARDLETAALIERTVLWVPAEGSALRGPAKPFVRG